MNYLIITILIFIFLYFWWVIDRFIKYEVFPKEERKRFTVFIIFILSLFLSFLISRIGFIVLKWQDNYSSLQWTLTPYYKLLNGTEVWWNSLPWVYFRFIQGINWQVLVIYLYAFLFTFYIAPFILDIIPIKQDVISKFVLKKVNLWLHLPLLLFIVIMFCLDIFFNINLNKEIIFICAILILSVLSQTYYQYYKYSIFLIYIFICLLSYFFIDLTYFYFVISFIIVLPLFYLFIKPKRLCV